MRKTFIWCRECRTVYDKSLDACPSCGAAPRHRFSEFGARRQATALMGARAAANLNAHALHAERHT